jgi:DUF438 domain-containing protein
VLPAHPDFGGRAEITVPQWIRARHAACSSGGAMSELIDNATRRKALLKDALLDLHRGTPSEAVQHRVMSLLGEVPHQDVVAVEQELVNEGMPVAELTKACDLHARALQGTVTLGRTGGAPAGHPVHTFRAENAALSKELAAVEHAYAEAGKLSFEGDATELAALLRRRFHLLMDVDKHYLRKEYLLFPALEKRGINGPPKVMWAKHDETRALLSRAVAALAQAAAGVRAHELVALVTSTLRPASEAVAGMIEKEERILLPMSYETVTEGEWADLARQEHEYGWCLVDPEVEWRPAGATPETAPEAGGRVRLPSGSFSPEELLAVFSTMPVDMTFVDADDRVRFFTQGKERIFARSRSIIGRKVQFCHPPSSVDTVERILEAFRAGTQERAAFWIELRGRFVHIEYLALRGADGRYLGCLEVSQDLTEKRALTGERRLLAWDAKGGPKPTA